MSGEAEFPATHTTRTTTTSEATSSQRRLFVDKDYLRTHLGRVKIVEMVLCLVAFLTVMVSSYPRSDRANWISFVTMGGFWFSFILFFLFLIRAAHFLANVPWVKLELVYAGLWTFFFFVAGCVAGDGATIGYGSAFAVCAFFCFVAMVVFGAHTVLLVLMYRKGESLTGTVTSRTTTTTTTTTTAKGSVVTEQRY